MNNPWIIALGLGLLGIGGFALGVKVGVGKVIKFCGVYSRAAGRADDDKDRDRRIKNMIDQLAIINWGIPDIIDDACSIDELEKIDNATRYIDKAIFELTQIKEEKKQ